MDAFLAHRRLIAAREKVAQPIASVKHVHISPDPVVFCAYHLAGDVGAPLAFLFGDDFAAPSLTIVGEPRNRDLRFRALEELARGFNTHLENCEGLDGAPQIVLPNTATADWLSVLARSTVYLPTDGDSPVDPALPRFGRALTHLTSRRGIAGSAGIIVASEVLGAHWATGQTDFEDSNLLALLSWIEPHWLDHQDGVSGVTELDGPSSALLAESFEPSGPVPDPVWDANVLEPLIAAFNDARRRAFDTRTSEGALRDAVGEALAPTWAATWRAIDIIRDLSDGAHVPARWGQDCSGWHHHLERESEGVAHFRRRRSVMQSAYVLSRSEDASARLEAETAFDDPLVMARHVAAGRAIEGRVVGRDLNHQAQGPRRMVQRPLLEIIPDDEVLVPQGTEVTLAGDVRVGGKIVQVPANLGDVLIIEIDRGHRGGSLPEIGELVCFATFAMPTYYPSTLPDGIPWTHSLPVAVENVEGTA